MPAPHRLSVLCAAAVFAAAHLLAADQAKDQSPATPASVATGASAAAPVPLPAAPPPAPPAAPKLLAAYSPAGTSPAANSPDAAPAARPAPAPGVALTADQTVKLPVFPVSASRLREIDLRIKKLTKQIEREKTALEKSSLDDTLNDEKISKTAALFGGKSTTQRDSVTAVRIESLEKELDLLDKLRTPLTQGDRALIEKLIEDQLAYRRGLDDLLR